MFENKGRSDKEITKEAGVIAKKPKTRKWLIGCLPVALLLSIGPCVVTEVMFTPHTSSNKEQTPQSITRDTNSNSESDNAIKHMKENTDYLQLGLFGFRRDKHDQRLLKIYANQYWYELQILTKAELLRSLGKFWKAAIKADGGGDGADVMIFDKDTGDMIGSYDGKDGQVLLYSATGERLYNSK